MEAHEIVLSEFNSIKMIYGSGPFAISNFESIFWFKQSRFPSAFGKNLMLLFFLFCEWSVSIFHPLVGELDVFPRSPAGNLDA